MSAFEIDYDDDYEYDDTEPGEASTNLVGVAADEQGRPWLIFANPSRGEVRALQMEHHQAHTLADMLVAGFVA
jgi:hypothetical protein